VGKINALIVYWQEASRSNSKNEYDKFLEHTMKSNRECTLRGQLELNKIAAPIDISEVRYHLCLAFPA
jgi:hypothetical protein